MTATMRCICKNDAKFRWSCQNFIEGTKMRNGNLAIVAAAQAAPVTYANLSSFFNAAKIPIMSKRNFLKISKHYVWPTIEEEYIMQQVDLINALPTNVSISMDGQYDSPGFSGMLEFIALRIQIYS